MSAIWRLRFAVMTVARNGSILRSRSSGCENTPWSEAVTAGLKFDSVLLAFVRFDVHATLYDPPNHGNRCARPTLPSQTSVRTPCWPKKMLFGGNCWTLRSTPL